MYYLGINKTTRLSEMIVYSTNPPIDDAVYTYRFEENPQNFMFRKFINGQKSSLIYLHQPSRRSHSTTWKPLRMV